MDWITINPGVTFGIEYTHFKRCRLLSPGKIRHNNTWNFIVIIDNCSTQKENTVGKPP